MSRVQWAAFTVSLIVGIAAGMEELFRFGEILRDKRAAAENFDRLQAAGGRRVDALLASGFKLIVHPALAYLFARFALGLDSGALFAAVVTSALPTAQNVFVAANRYRTGIIVAKDTVLLTTVVAVPAMIGVALLLA